MKDKKVLPSGIIRYLHIILFIVSCMFCFVNIVCGDTVHSLDDPSAFMIGNWSVEGEDCRAFGDGTMSIATDDWKDYSFKVKFITDAPGANDWDTAAIRFRSVNDYNYYYAIIHKTGILEFGKVMNGEKFANLVKSETGAKISDWNEFSIDLKGNTAVILLNGKESARYTDPDPILSGGITLWSLGAKECRFKHISASTPAGEIKWRGNDIDPADKTMNRNTVGVFTGSSVADNATVKSVMKSLTDAGFKTIAISPDDAEIDSKIAPKNFFLYVIPNSNRYPSAGLKVLQNYLRRKGNLIVLGGPAFSDPVNKINFAGKTKWYDLETFKKEIAETEGTADSDAYLTTVAKDSSKWSMLDVIDDNWSVSEVETQNLKLTSGADGGITKNNLLYSADKVGGWGTFAHQIPAGMIKSEHDSLALWAKSDANTPQFIIELREKDGSRWMYAVNASEKWKYYEIPFKSFKYWKSVPTRGGAGDYFKGANGDIISVGLALSNCKVPPGAHSFMIDGLSFTSSSLLNFSPNSTIDPIETIYPAYKTYRLGKIPGASVEINQSILSSATFAPKDISAISQGAVSPISRPKGMGFNTESQCRWIPLVNVYDGKEKRGTIVSLTVNNSGRYKDAICGSIGVDKLDANMSGVLRDMAIRIKAGLFLIEGGTEHFSYYQNEPVKLGAKVANFGSEDKLVKVRIYITDGDKTIWKDESIITAYSGQRNDVIESWQYPDTGKRSLAVKVLLISEGKIIDRIEHELAMLPPKGVKPPADTFVTVSGGDFYLNGKKWYANGINYWPRYVNGMEDVNTWCSWFNSDFYQPDEVEKDLDLLNKMGVNLVSVQMIMGKNYNGLDYPASSLRNIQDFLRRCGNHSIKVNCYLMHSSPIVPVHSEYNSAYVQAILTSGDFANNSAIFAYDLIWEASGWLYMTGKYKDWDADWNKWIIERYHTIESAVRDWGFYPERIGDLHAADQLGGLMGIPRKDDLLASPTLEQLSKNPPDTAKPEENWLKYVAAYRRFADDFVSQTFNETIRFMKMSDPNHLFSVRGSGGVYSPVDFFLNGIAKHLDFISPEGYGISSDSDGFNTLGFQTRLIRSLVNKPIYIAEFGMSIWDDRIGGSDPLIEKHQGDYYEKFFKIADEAGINGLAPWWYPGGFRTGENSDYGVINPDGTLRLAARNIMKYADKFTSPRKYPEADEWMTIDREDYAGGYYALIHNKGREAFAKAVASGKHLGIKTPGMGMNSANAPLLAVGNVPYNYSNPPKYLNGEFNKIMVKCGDGEWLNVYSKDASVSVEKGKPIYIKAQMGNIGEASWLAPSTHAGDGSVYLSSRYGDFSFKAPIVSDSEYLRNAETNDFLLSEGLFKTSAVTFELIALNRMWFGEKFKITFTVK